MPAILFEASYAGGVNNHMKIQRHRHIGVVPVGSLNGLDTRLAKDPT
jgi:hypothetical protein